MQNREAQKTKNAMFFSLMNYMYLRRVETILFFVAASRNADLDLHLEAGEALSKMFFSIDRLKYNPNARQRFFFASAELPNLSKDFKDQFLKPSSRVPVCTMNSPLEKSSENTQQLQS